MQEEFRPNILKSVCTRGGNNMKLDKNTWRIVYFMQKVTEFDDLPEERRDAGFKG